MQFALILCAGLGARSIVRACFIAFVGCVLLAIVQAAIASVFDWRDQLTNGADVAFLVSAVIYTAILRIPRAACVFAWKKWRDRRVSSEKV